MSLVLLAAVAVTAYIGHRWLELMQLQWKNDRLDQRKWHEDAHDIAKKEVAVKEREIALKEQSTKKPEKPVKMPDDLLNRILAWEDSFAQEAERQTITDLYAEFEDWDTVRTKLAPMLAVMPQREEFIG